MDCLFGHQRQQLLWIYSVLGIGVFALDCLWATLSIDPRNHAYGDSVSVLVAKSEFRSGFRWCQNQTPITKETKPTPRVSNKQMLSFSRNSAIHVSLIHVSVISPFLFLLTLILGGKNHLHSGHIVFEIGSIQCLTIPLPSSRAWSRLFFHFTNERICCFNAGLGSSHANSFLFVSFSTPTLLVTLAFL